MQYEINRNMVADMLQTINAAVSGKGFKYPEAVIALQEMVGRTIVEMCTTPVQAEPLKAMAKKHLDDTVEVGFSAKGINTAPVV